MSNPEILNDILAHTDKGKLNQFIREYAAENEDFRSVFLNRFSPKPKPLSGSKRKQPEDDYVKRIQQAFTGTVSKRSSRNRYRDAFEDIGFDAEAVSASLMSILEKARFYIRHDNKDEAIRIAQQLIDTIPDYWEVEFDYDGDVQAVYDETIELLEELLREGQLSDELMSTLFNWYEKAIAEKKHAYVGFNASLDDLEQYFARDGAVGLDRVLRIMDNKIAHSDEYEVERAVLDKIGLLLEHGRTEEAEKTIETYLKYPGVRSIKFNELIENRQYDDAIKLLEEGIVIAQKKQALSQVNVWRKELLSVYTQLNNREKMLEITKVLLVEGGEPRTCYQTLKKLTPKKEWPEMLVWILRRLTVSGAYNAIELKADIFVEHAMWEELWQLCRKEGLTMVRKYEKKLLPHYEKEVFSLYHQYVQKQATITDKEAYKRVADMLIRMVSFEGGPAVVKQLVTNYRQLYKRRLYMMKELDRVKC